MKINFYVGFNNYYNRKVIVHDSLDDYQDYLLLTIPNVNFKPKDGINTEQIVNTTQAVDYQVFNLSNTPDYAVVADDDNTIISRWFVTQYESLIYKNQYRAVLRRDVIADKYDAVVEAPVFIEKATITDKNDPAIFNSEDMGFNQIKTSEILLKDTSDIPWIVGYIPSNQVIGFPHIDEDHPLTPETVIDPITVLVGNETVNKWYKVQSNSLQDLYDVPSFPYRMFCMPYADVKIWYEKSGITTYTEHKKEVALAIATGIAKSMGSGAIFDVQLLPYCPLRSSDGDNKFTKTTKQYGGQTIECYDITGIGDTNRFYYMYETTDSDGSTTGNRAGVMFFCNNNKFSFDITCSLPLPDTALEMKVKNETEMYRLCSPNYNGQFEFNPMKNGGVTKFNVDCTYQPFAPYIHINPDFGRLYGSDFDDCRGLICSGDFSLPQETNAWANYIQNNKNYQQTFDRQIQNMEVMNMYARQSQAASIVGGTAQGAGALGFYGAGFGAAGGPVGAVAGGILSAGAGVADYLILKEQQKETLNYTIDQFGYQLGNIKAMPNSISKASPFTNNNKIFPVLEYYTCTDEEVDALKNKMEYNGMTIMRIGKIKDWLLEEESYIKGKLIMLDSSIEEDYHTVIEIAQELDKGIRAKKEA